MSIDALQLRHEIIRPVLKYLEPEIPYSMAAENLLMGTCAQESKMGQWLVQLNEGPAKGIFQMEPATHDDIIINYLDYRGELQAKVEGLTPGGLAYDTLDQLVGNVYYAAAMCRVHYFRVSMAMPAEDDVTGLGEYWKNFYNTQLGKGSIAEFIHNYNMFVA